jgi:N-acetylglucosaminyldiphosphoundecaprenol N-acetyl-beta-D-mannosaminyltransferase
MKRTGLAKGNPYYMNTVELFDFKISAEGLENDVAQALRWVEERRGFRYMACANPHSLVVASRDELFRKALREADLLTPDGVGVVLATGFLNLPLHRRVVGYDFFMDLTKQMAAKGGFRFFFLGSSDRVLQLIVERLNQEFPSITVCGTYTPPFSDAFSADENERMVAAVNAARPDVLWVGMTAPKQEKWIFENRHNLRVSFTSGIGAVFEFYAGTVERAPKVWQRMGLEWFYRFAREPSRLWERNLISTPKFIIIVLKEKYRQLFGTNKK